MTSFGVRTRGIAPLFLLAAGVAALTACHDSTTVQEPTTPTTVSIAAGDTQTVFTDSTAALPFTVLVVNQNGSPLNGIPVTWTIDSGGGALSDTVTTTNADGHGLVAYTAPQQPVDAVIDATVGGLPTVMFHVKVVSPPEANLVGLKH